MGVGWQDYQSMPPRTLHPWLTSLWLGKMTAITHAELLLSTPVQNTHALQLAALHCLIIHAQVELFIFTHEPFSCSSFSHTQKFLGLLTSFFSLRNRGYYGCILSPRTDLWVLHCGCHSCTSDFASSVLLLISLID